METSYSRGGGHASGGHTTHVEETTYSRGGGQVSQHLEGAQFAHGSGGGHTTYVEESYSRGGGGQVSSHQEGAHYAHGSRGGGNNVNYVEHSTYTQGGGGQITGAARSYGELKGGTEVREYNYEVSGGR